METADVRALKRALLEIEWTSRKSPARDAVKTINDIARAALVAEPATAAHAGSS